MLKESATLRAAKRYLSLGWSVIPLKPNSKEPLIPWQEFQKRLPTEQELMKWFQEEKNNIGIVTGEISGLSVVDVDGLLPDLLNGIHSPITVKTRRGSHLYFVYGGENNSVSKIAEHVDVRGEGGFIVAPPSIIDSHTYRFVNPYFRIDSLPRFPSDLLPKKEEIVQGRLGKPEGWVAEALKGMQIGNIDNTLVSVLGSLRRNGYSEQDAYMFIHPHADRAGATPGHLEEKIAHVWKSYENKRSISVPSGISRNVTDFLSLESKVEWLVPEVFSKQSLGFLVGLPECGKTWAAMDLAIELSRGGYWLGRIKTNKAKVLFIDQERAISETQRRFKALLAEKGLTKEEISAMLYIDVSSHRKMDLDNSYQSFRNELMEIKPDVIIVDSFVTFHTKDENSRMEVQKVLDRIKALREEFGCATLFVNHESKMAYQDAQENQEPTAGRMVGSIGVIAAADSILSFKKVNEATSSIYHTKNSLANQIESFMFSVLDTPKGIKIEANK